MKNGVYEIIKVLPHETSTLVVLKEVTSGKDYQLPVVNDDVEGLKIEKGRFLIYADRGYTRLFGTMEEKELALKEYVKFNFN